MVKLIHSSKSTFSLFILSILLLFSSSSARAALSGVYTIDSSLAASSTNYRDFLSAVSDLKLGTRSDGGTPNGTGVTGPVVFNVASGTYVGQLDITAITGVSAVNTITFDGLGNAANCIVQASPTAAATSYTIRINNAQYIILRSLTIRGAGASFGWPLHLFNVSSNVKVKNCIIDFTTPQSLHTSNNFCALVINNSATSPTGVSTSLSNIEIDSNRFIGGYANYFSGTSVGSGINIRGNTFDSTDYYGLYVSGVVQAQIINNTFNLKTNSNISSFGIYFLNSPALTGNFHEISANKITNAAQYGIYIGNSNGQTATRSKLYNNVIAGGFRNTTNPAGLYFTSSYAWNVFNNSVNLDVVTSGTQAAPIFIGNCCTTGATLLDVRNNIFAVTAVGSSAYALYMPNGYIYAVANTASLNYNIYFKQGISNNDPFIYSGGTILTMANFVNNSSYNANSFAGNPLFTSGRNLLPITPCNNGVQITDITTSINGVTRNNPPDIGAYEVIPIANDIGIERITSPALPFNAGLQNISLLLRNYGNNTLTSANAYYSVNQASAANTTWSGSLASCATTTVNFTGGNQYNFIANTEYNIKAYTDFPNGTNDANTINDTTTIPVVFSALAGNYTIDQSSLASATNFVSFSAAATALNNGGVSGPVLFTVLGSTPYVEQISLSNVQGVSATNTITFDGGTGNAANRIINFAATTQVGSHTIRVNNTQWVRLRNLTIRGSGLSWAWPVHLLGNASNSQVRNCIIDYIGGVGVNGTSDAFTGIVVNGSTSSITTNSTPNNIDLDSNQIIGGNNGIYIYSQNGYNLNMRGNTISNANFYGIYIYYSGGFKCNNNTIAMRATGSISSNGIYSNFCLNGGYQHEVINNVVTDAGQYGIQFYYLQGGTTNPARVINNMIGGAFRSTDPAAMYFNQNCQYVNLWFNSLVLDNATNGAQSSVIKFLNSCSSIDMRNNNIASNNASANTYALYADATSSGFSNLNYNNYYKAGNTTSRFIFLNGNNYSLANYKGALGYNQNSVSIDPTYTSSKNLKTTLVCNNGIAIAGVTTDFEGELRNNPPDIGCDENLSASSLDLSVSAISGPTLPLSIGTQNVRVVIRNNGTSSISSATVNYQVNGGGVQTINWTGTLNACDTQTVEFNATSGPGASSQQVTFLPGIVYTITAYTSLPNGSPDLVAINDTAKISNVCAGLAGTFIIDSAAAPSATTFNSFTSAITALTCGGISGPVIFNVATGTYNGQLDLTAVQGVSATNTITFDGGIGNATTRIVNFAATSTAFPFTFRLNNTRFITLRNLTIRGSGTTTAWPLHIFGTCNTINIKNCIIDFVGGNGLTGTTDNYVGIVMNNFASAPNATSGTSPSANIEIDSNFIIGGNTSTYLIGNGTNTNVFFRNNNLDSANANGLYVSNMIGPKINNNIIEMRSIGASASSQGIYLASVSSNALFTAEINRNRVIDGGIYGIYVINSSGITAARSQMINNSFGGGFRNASPYGMFFSSSNFWNIWNNSVNIDNAATGSTSAIYFTGTNNNDCRNNNFVISNSSASINMYPFRSTAGVTFTALNYNNYFKATLGLQHIQVNGTNYDTLAYNTTLAGGLNAVRINPAFAATRNLLPTTALANGILLTSVPTDILNVLRNNPPTLGAYELASSATVDLGIVSVISPDTFLSAGLQNVTLVLKNFGANTINSFNIRHTVNGANLQDSAFTGLSLATNDTLQVTLINAKRANIIPATLSTFKVYLHQPNGSTDNNLINDTVTIGPKIAALKGIYTINPSGSGVSNFTSFRNAVNALNTAGIAGAVTFMVSAATYNEQINLVNVAGNSNINTITFDGGTGNAATRIIDTAANTSTNFWTVRLNNAPNIAFRNLTIRSSGNAFASAIHVLGNSHFCKFKSCVIEITGAGATSTNTNYVPVIINNSTSITSLTTGSQVNNLEFDSNTINSGYYGIYAYSVTSTPYAFNNKFRRNSILNAFNTGLYMYYQDGMSINNNTIALRSSATNGYGMYLYFCYTTGTNFHTVNANKITNPGSYGIYAYFFGSNNARHSIANNMIGGGFKVNGSYGLNLQYANNVDVFNNSINLDLAQTGSDQYAALYLYSGSSIDVRNNIFANTGGSTNVGLPVYVGALPTGIFRLDNNNYFRPNTTNTNLMYIGSNYYNTSNYLGGSGYNLASFNKNPNWVSVTDLHVLEGCTKGINVGIADDIDGQTRGTLPNIGADEYVGANNDVGLVSIAPFSVGLQNVRVVIRNYGSNTISSANVSYSVNGGLAKTILWSGSLAPCDTVSVVFTGANQFNFAMGTAYQITAYTSNPNFTSDPRTSNDTVSIGPSCVFLNGNYTINASGSGVNNFTSFSAAAAALNCGGISGPVKFTVAAGTYNEQITLTAIVGSSITNTITFDGDTALNRVITFSPTVNTEYHTIRLNNASNITFRNLNIQNNGVSQGAGIHLMAACNNIKIKNCIVQITGAPASSSSSAYAPIVLNNSNDGNNITSAGSQANGVEIDSNRIVGGYYGIVLSSNTGSPYLTNTLVRNNTIDSSFYYGIYTYYNNGLTFNNNTVNMRINGSANSNGVYLYFNFGQGTNAFTVMGNKVNNAGQYGMYLFYTYSASSLYRSICANNMIGGNFRNPASVGLYCSNLNYWDIFNNSVNLDIPTNATTASAMYVQAGTAHDIRNNMLVYSATSGSGIPFNASAASVLSALDFNNYYSNANSNLVTVGTTAYTSSNFMGGAGFNANSRNQNPGFTSATDLHIGSGCINGTQIAGITTDIDGNVRNIPPDVGADEYIGSINNDIGVSFIIVPQIPFTAGLQDVRVRLNNFGANTITAATIRYTINGGSMKTINWTGTLNPCDTTSILFTGSNQFNFAFGTSYNLKAYTEQPNGVSDANKGNDTISVAFCTAFNGVYTINPTGSGTSNFTSISAAANAIACGGVSGPVIFNIAPGTYNEQVTINAIPGASAINTITFDGGVGNAASRIVSFTPTLNIAAHTLQLNNSPFVSILNLTVVSNGATFGNPIHVFGSSNSCKIRNCIVSFGSAAQTSTNTGYVGILVNGFNNVQSPTSNGSYITGLEVDSNTISYGYYGILLFGVSSTPLSANNNCRFNRIDSSYYYGFYAYYQDGLKVRSNTINIRANGTASSVGIYLYVSNSSGSNSHEIVSNKVVNAGQYGLYVYFSSNPSGNRGRIINNMIGGGFRSNNATGLYIYFSDNWDIWNNSVNLDFPTTSNTLSAFSANYSTLDIRNNHFAYTAASGTGLPFYLSSTSASLNYNNYFNASSNNLLFYSTTTYTTSTFLGGGGVNANSVNVNPQFASRLNLRTGGCIKGVAIAGVSTDIDGDTRNTPPDIGADEALSNDAGVIAITAPTQPITPGLQNVSVVVKNFGRNTITSLSVTYNINGNGPVTQALTGLTLQPCSTQTVTFTGTQQFNFGGVTYAVVYTSLPNGATDNFRLNDTLRESLCGPLNGVYTINAAGSGAFNFTSFGAAVNSLICAGITGPVTFNVAAGTYTEQLDITPITGASATNTITFDGGVNNASTRVLTFAASINNLRHTLRFNACQFVTFRNITIQTTGTSLGWGVHYLGAANNNSIKNCIVDLAGANAASSTNNTFIGIVGSNSTTNETSQQQLQNVVIDSNTINNGYYGIILYGNATTQSTGTLIRRNIVNNAYYYGIYLYSQNGFTLNNNTSTNRTGVNASQNAFGLYINNCIATTTNYNEIDGNKVTDAIQYGLYINASSSSASRSRIWNNMIGGGFTSANSYGIFLSGSNNWDVFQNSVNLDASTNNNQYAALYIGSGSNNAVKNNILSYTATSGVGLPFYATSTANFTSPSAVNYNNYFKTGLTGTNPLLYLGGNYNLTNFTTGGSNANSISVNPLFVAAKNLHINDGCYNGDSIGVTTDFDGNTRASFADIGADELPSGIDDIGVKQLLQPTIPIAVGLSDISVIIKNYGSNAVMGGTVKYSINNATPVSLSFTDTIQPCTIDTIRFTGSNQFNFVGGNTYGIKVYTESPNGNSDTYAGNDTLSIPPVCVGMAGAYTINATGSGANNFTSFTNAINALLCGGVSGSVTFAVAPATYTEQIVIPFISGTSVTNTIVFDGGTGNAATRILVTNATTTNTRHTLRFDNTSFIQFRNLTVRNTGTNWAWPIHIYGSCNSIKVKNCIIEVTGVGATSNSTNYINVVVSNSFTSHTNGSLVDSVEIDSNIINGSYASIWDYNNNGTANRFRGNTLNNPTNYGIYVYNTTEVKANYNTINMWPLGPNTSTGIYFNFCLTSGAMAHEVIGNKIFDMGQYGMYGYFAYGSAGSPSLMNNNMIGSGFRNTTSHSGIFLDYAINWNIDHNSVVSDTSISTLTGLLNITNSSAINVRNNIFSVSNASSQCIPLNVPTASNVSIVNYNNYYKAGNPSTLITIGANYSPSTFIGGGSYNSNSINRDPLFVSRRDLHVTNSCNNGIAIGNITTDIDGNARNNPPDIGADEVTGGTNNNIGVTAMLSPLSPITAGLQTVSVIISNLGNNIVSSADIKYQVNGGTPIVQSWSGTLNPCDTTLITFTTPFNILSGTAYTIKAFTSLPNGVPDANTLDDTLTVGPLCQAMAGNYTIDAAGSGANNFTSFTNAVNALQCGGIVAPTIFTVANGTYVEQVNINAINGVNDTTRVTFIGQSQNGVVLNFNALTPTSTHTLRLNSSSYINFYNMTIQASGTTYGTAVHLLGASNFVKIKNCNISINGVAATGASQYHIPLLINGSNDITNLTNNGTSISNIEIDSNKMYAGYYSMYYNGRSSTPYSKNNMFRRNTMDSAYFYAVYANYAEGFKFLNNNVNVRVIGTASSVGLYMNNCYNTGISFHDVSNNKITGAGLYGVYMYFSSGISASNRSRFVNNMVGGAFRNANSSGLYWQYSDFWNIYNNTVNLDFATNNAQFSAASFYHFTTYNLDLRNNIFSYTPSTGAGLPFYVGGTGTINTFNYNNFHNGASTNLINLNGTTYTTLNYVGGGGYNANSFNSNVPFIGTRDLHLTNSTNKGITIASVQTDIDGETRLSPPDIGADEYFSTMDIGVLSVDSPVTNFCGATKNIVVKLRNYGTQTVTSAIINWSINGVSQSAYSWSGSLNAGATSAQIVLGTFNFTNGGTFNITAFSTLPNLTTDVNPNNDTASSVINVTGSVTPTISIAASNTSICSAMSVTFTASITNGGTAPAYQWRINGITVGTNSNTYTSSTLAHNDSVVCILSSSANCATIANVVSNHVKMNVGTSLFPDVNIATANTTICASSSVTFTATPVNGGTAPSYQWKRNGINVGTDTNVYSPSVVNNNDSFTVVLTSSLTCAIPNKDTSNFIKITVNPLTTPSVSITAFATSFCAGTIDTFTAVAANAGIAPSYQWKKNAGVNIGTNSNKLIINNLSNNDSVYVLVTSNGVCPSTPTATSSKIGVTVTPAVIPTAIVTSATNSICSGSNIKFNVTTTNGGTAPSLVWKKNGTSIATNVDSIIISTLANNDTIYAEYTSNATCASPTFVTSNKKVITVNPIVTPDVSITASTNNVCAGTSVQFAATPINGGAIPHYQWYKNGVAVGFDSAKYTSSAFANGDSITVVLTSNAICTSKLVDTSSSVKLTINPVVSALIAVTASQTNICFGSNVTFTRTISNGGTAPQYQWKRNGVTVGTDSTYSSNTLTNNDTVYAVLVSNANCLSANNVSSNKIAMQVVNTVIPIVNIATTSTSICSGSSVVFSATAANGGTSPQYQWKKNGINVGTNNDSFTTALLADKDSISLQMTSSAACASPAIAFSNIIRISVIPTVTPTVTITANATSVCVGSAITFRANATNGGSGVQYQWKRNGINVGTNDTVFTTSVLANNDSVSLQMTSSVSCATTPVVTSNKIKVSIAPTVTPIVNVNVSANNVCSGTTVVFNATNSNGGTTPIHIWLKNGAVVGTDSIKYTTAVNYGDEVKCILTSNVNCLTKAKDTTTAALVIKRLPAKPVITKVGDTLISTIANSYQWYVNNIEIPGGSNQKQKAKQNGNFIVVVDSLGCANASDIFVVNGIGIKEAIAAEFVQLAPNPTSGLLNLTARFANNDETIVSVYDMSGKQLMQLALSKANNIDGQLIDLSDMKSGIYMIHVLHGKQLTARKVVKAE